MISLGISRRNSPNRWRQYCGNSGRNLRKNTKRRLGWEKEAEEANKGRKRAHSRMRRSGAHGRQCLPRAWMGGWEDLWMAQLGPAQVRKRKIQAQKGWRMMSFRRISSVLWTG